ncbi:Ima1 N-terminal domain-containing protein [Irpex lacteus]|nr:Ima1 N-terminal domain-containing protein [Irpex lacteus]
MSKLLRRPTLTLTRAVTCFYCQTEQQPRDARSFRCLACSCWNRYDKKGQIMSDDPAMYDASLNTRSFARRASPRKDRLPSMYSQHRQSLFCHECQTNQMLISNLLSNYLPSQDDPDYNRLLAQLPAYQSSLETRYPPICANCLPAVEEEIKCRDNMARTSALGGFLKESRGKERQRQVAVSRNQKEALERQLVMWKVRGVLWGVTLAVFLIVYGIVTVGHSLPGMPSFLRTILPVIVLLSISWTAWDPTYASLKRSQLQGRAVRQRGKKEYNILQFLAWVSRILTVLLISVSSRKPSWDFLHFHSHDPLDTDTPSPYSPRTQWYFRILLALELIILTRSLFVLRIDRPPPVRLMQQFSHRPTLSSASSSRQSTPVIENPPDMFSALTLSNKPILPNQHQHYQRHQRHQTHPSGRSDTPPRPVFGMTSFSSAGMNEGNGGAGTNSMMTMDANGSAMNMNEDDDDNDDFNNGDWDGGEDGDGDGNEERDHDPNAMDWSPIAPTTNRRSIVKMTNGGGQVQQYHYPGRQQRYQQTTGKTNGNGNRRWDDGSWLRPQRFFVPEEPTGLEGLFEQTISLSDDDRLRVGGGEKGEGKGEWLGWAKRRWRSEQ